MTALDTKGGENSHRFPVFLANGKRFLCTVSSTTAGVSGLYAGSLDDPKQKIRLSPSTYTAVYAPPLGSAPGYLLWARDQSLVAQPFDAQRLRLMGDAAPVSDLAGFLSVGTEISISQNGVMVEGPRAALEMQLAWFSRDGKTLETLGEPDFYECSRLSPDGRKIAVERGGLRRPGDDRGSSAARFQPVECRFGRLYDSRVVARWNPNRPFRRKEGCCPRCWSRTPTVQARRKSLRQSGRSLQVTDWSRDGRLVVYSYLDDTQNQSDLWVLPLDGERKPQRLIGAPGGAVNGQLSPDGKWIAYASKESGRYEVYVRAFPVGPQKWQVFSEGGNHPRWRRDGKELFYAGRSSKVTAVAVKTGAASLEFEAPRALFPLPILYAVPHSYGLLSSVAPISSASISLQGRGSILTKIVRKDRSTAQGTDKPCGKTLCKAETFGEFFKKMGHLGADQITREAFPGEDLHLRSSPELFFDVLPNVTSRGGRRLLILDETGYPKSIAVRQTWAPAASSITPASSG